MHVVPFSFNYASVFCNDNVCRASTLYSTGNVSLEHKLGLVNIALHQLTVCRS